LAGSKPRVCNPDKLITLPNGKLFNRGAGRGYRGWPRSNVYNTVESALRCAEYYRDRVDGPEEELWITAKQAALFSGLPFSLVRSRTKAALEGRTEAWPWCALKPGPLLYLPELWEECQWVKRIHAWHYLGIASSKFDLAGRKGVLHFEDRVFRIVDPDRKDHPNYSVRIDEVIRYRTFLKMRELFGKHFSYERLDTLLELDVETVSRIFFAKLLTGGTYADTRRPRDKPSA
jgi:hypothetical protein